jgi:hypothetical protein
VFAYGRLTDEQFFGCRRETEIVRNAAKYFQSDVYHIKILFMIITTLRRALTWRMWGLNMRSVPEYFLRGYAKSRRGSRARTFDFNGNLVAAVEHLRLNFVRPLSRSAELNKFRSALAKTRGSGSILSRNPQVQSAIALLNLGIKRVERLRRSE